MSAEEGYAQKVFNYSKLDSEAAYFSGTHYRRLGQFLISPYRTYGDERKISIADRGFDFATVCDLTKRWDDHSRTKQYSSPSQLVKGLKGSGLEAGSEIIDEGDNDSGQGESAPLNSTC